MIDAWLLPLILFAPVLGAVVLIVIPNQRRFLVQMIAAGSSFVSFILSFYLLYAYDHTVGGYQFVQRVEWSGNLGISFALGVDGIAVPLVLASSILLFTGIFISWHIKDRLKEFYVSLLILAAATIGVYVSLDLFFLYFFYELSVIPMYLLLGMWGSHTKNYNEMKDTQKRDFVGFILNFTSNSKEYAAMKLVLFLSAGAVVALLGILLIYVGSGLNTFDIPTLAEHAQFSGTLATAIWLLVFFGFASIAPLWPLHSWSPVGHAAAPAATSMLHAGVLMKLGHFSIIRVGYEILPEATRDLMPIAAILCVFSIVYGGWVAYSQNDTKYVIGYSSSSHMGYIFLGMAALTYVSVTGAVLYMFAHALATGLLFALAGWVYDQTHTRDIPSLGGLSRTMPFATGCFVVAVAASFGLPGTVSFIGELMILLGSWNKYPVQTIIAVLGIVVTMAYLFRMLRGVFFWEPGRAMQHETELQWADTQDTNGFVNRMPLLVMIACIIYFGIFPGQFIDVIGSSVEPLLAKIHAGTEAPASPSLSAASGTGGGP